MTRNNRSSISKQDNSSDSKSPSTDTEHNSSPEGDVSIPAMEVEVEALEIVRKESRVVLKEQLEFLSDIDDKAMRTVRTSVLFIGLVISAIQLSGDPISIQEMGKWPFRFSTAGVTFLLASIIAGIYTYSVSDLDFGVSNGHRKDVVAGGFTEREWLIFQLSEYNQWTDSMGETNKNNVVGLHATLFSLVAGVLSLLVSGVLTMDIELGRFSLPAIVAILIVVVVTVVLWMAR